MIGRRLPAVPEEAVYSVTTDSTALGDNQDHDTLAGIDGNRAFTYNSYGTGTINTSDITAISIA